VVEQLPEHELVCGSEPAWERGEGEAVAEQQPPRASSCEAATSSRGRRLGVVEALLPEKHPTPYLARQMSKWFCDTSTSVATGAARYGFLLEGALVSWSLALGERGEHDDLRGSGRLSVIPYVHGRTELYCAQTCLA
jgi:hypothetical protein